MVWLISAYLHGRGVKVDKEKAEYYTELAAIAGNVEARHNLGNNELDLGNMEKAVKHHTIAVYDYQGNEVDNKKCPFCRAQTPSSEKAAIERYKERVEANILLQFMISEFTILQVQMDIHKIMSRH